jgi:hypothetical protein
MHTIAAGAEARWERLTITVGYARALAAAVDLDAQNAAVNRINVFDGTTGPIGAGRHDRASDAFGLTVEMTWP